MIHKRCLIIVFFIIASTSCGSLALISAAFLAARATASKWRPQRKIDVFGRIKTDHERGNVHKLVANADVAVADKNTCVVDRLCQSHEEDLSLEAAFKEIFWLEVKNKIKFHSV